MKVGKKGRNIRKKEEKKISGLSRLVYYLGLIAGISLAIIGFRYVFSENSGDRLFGFLTLLESLFAFSGLIFMELFSTGKFKLKPEKFAPLHPNLFIRTAVISISLMAVQILFQLPLSAKPIDKMLAIIFAAPSEELFFRGLIMSLFIQMGRDNRKSLKITDKIKFEISVIEIVGILLSGIIFALLHVNYYSNIMLMMAVGFSGVILSLFYVIWEDMTANILGHFLINILVVIQTIFVVVV